jgi:hypothetical protein
MKTNIKLFGIMALLAIVVLSLAVVGCSDEPTPPPQEQAVGQVPEMDASGALTGNNIPIYKGAGVTDAKVAAAVTNIQNGYAVMATNPTSISKLGSKITKIVIVLGDHTSNSATKATGVIEIGEDCSEADIRGFLNSVAAPAFTQVIDNSRNTVRIVYATVPDTVFA